MNRTRNLTAILAGLTTLILILTQPNSQAQRFLSSVPPSGFTGRYIAAIADGDFLASTYQDGKLPESNSATDILSIVDLPLRSQNAIAKIPASNSVTGAPYAFDLSPDDRMAFVVETLGAMPAGATHREQLPPGEQLVAIDLSEPNRPVVRTKVAIAPLDN